MIKDNTLILIDGSSYLYRAFHALPPLMNSQGQPTGAIYGVLNMLKRWLNEERPSHVAMVFDAKGPTFRDHMYERYKANRKAMPDALISQIEPLYKIIQAMGLPLLCIEGVEADDVIGTLAKQAEATGIQVAISTGDKDLTQLVNDRIILINTMTNTKYDREGVIKKFGLPPEKMIDYLTLVGDSSDNIPGVPGCGPKKAVKLLTEFGTLDQLISHSKEIKGKIGDNLRASFAQLALSKQLITIKLDVPLPINLEDLKPKPADSKALMALYQQLELKTLLSEVKASIKDTPTSLKKNEHTTNYQTILTQEALDLWIARLKKSTLFAFNTETTALSYVNAEIVGVSFSIKENEAAYVPLAHDYIGAPIQLNREKILEQLKPLLENPEQKKIGQHIKYDMNVLSHYNIHLQGLAFDTMLESYVYDSTGTQHDMDSLTKKYLHKEIINFKDVAGKGKNQLTFNQVPIKQATEYAAKNADITFQLHQILWPKIQKIPKLPELLTSIELPLIKILSEIECTGVLIDKNYLLNLSKIFGEKMEMLRKDIIHEAGQEFNLDSPKQLQEILFKKMGFPIIKKTETGQTSTAEPILQELAKHYRLPALIIDYRMYAKLKSTYTDKLPSLINVHTGRVHTSYHQANTSTGRLSSSNPNLQNIPVRTEAGHAIRQGFIVPAGYKILTADYSQIELRIMAHLSGDKSLLNAFAHGKDIHRATAAEVFSVSLKAVNSEQRRHAKIINFGLIYGMSAFGLAKQLNLPRHTAQKYIDLYFQRYSGVKNYMDKMRHHAKKEGFVETLCGRRLYLPNINDRNHSLQRGAERAAINAPLQGTAADIIKIAMINIDRVLKDEKIDARMIMQVHDELIFEVNAAKIDKAKIIIEKEMRTALTLHAPLVVNIGVGDNWDVAH